MLLLQHLLMCQGEQCEHVGMKATELLSCPQALWQHLLSSVVCTLSNHMTTEGCLNCYAVRPLHQFASDF